MTDRISDASRAVDANTTSTLRYGSPSLDVVTRLLIGLLRQTAHDQAGGKPVMAQLEQTMFGRGELTPQTRTVERVAENARAVVRKEFLGDEDAKRYALRWSILPDDLPDRSGAAGDAELTVHPIDDSRLQSLVMPREPAR